jgi:hypothetical protein
MFVALKSGENKTANKAFKDSCFTGHMANISQTCLQQSNWLLLVHSLKNEADLRGLFILNVKNDRRSQRIA